MKTNKKILVATITIATLAGTTITSADFSGFGGIKNFGGERMGNFQNVNGEMQGPGMGQRMGRHGGQRANGNAFSKLYENAGEEIQALIDKIKEGEDLTTEEKSTLREYAKTQRAEMREKRAEIREIMKKYRNGEELTDSEKATLTENRPENAEKRFEEMLENANISDEVKAILTKQHNFEVLTEDEEDTLEAHKEEQKAQREEIRDIMEKYRDGEELTSEERELVLDNRPAKAEEMFNQRMEDKNISDEIKAIMTKQFNLETLTEDEQETLEQFREERRSEMREERGNGNKMKGGMGQNGQRGQRNTTDADNQD